MAQLTGQQLLEQLNWRYAVKKFDAAKKISAQDWKTLEQVLTLTPSSYGLQPWKFLIVQNPEVRKKLTPLSWNQTQIEDCSHLVVMAHMKKMTEEHIHHHVVHTATLRGVSVESMKGYEEMMVGNVVKGPRAEWSNWWCSRQAYIAMGNLMTSAALLGIDTCPMEGFDPEGYDKVLGLTGTNFQSVSIVACGYRSSEDGYAKLKKSRFDVSDVVKIV
jgi:nitroreductase